VQPSPDLSYHMEVVFHVLFIHIPFTIIFLIAVENSVDWPVCHSFVSSFDITSRMIKDQVLRSWLVGQMCQECKILVEAGISVMVFKATFNNISVISWLSVLLVEEAGVPGENHRPVASHWQTWSYNVVSSTPRHEWVWTHSFRGDMHYRWW